MRAAGRVALCDVSYLVLAALRSRRGLVPPSQVGGPLSLYNKYPALGLLVLAFSLTIARVRGMEGSMKDPNVAAKSHEGLAGLELVSAYPGVTVFAHHVEENGGEGGRGGSHRVAIHRIFRELPVNLPI